MWLNYRLQFALRQPDSRICQETAFGLPFFSSFSIIPNHVSSVRRMRIINSQKAGSSFKKCLNKLPIRNTFDGFPGFCSYLKQEMLPFIFFSEGNGIVFAHDRVEYQRIVKI
ncbi:hypothetical protein CEXT_417191 [Caerostris extrusa]|uniref:Uncharacterized protein n=1 Tax=Caerostris extrusa TaxID=172846 RepID=A0AAV4QJJ5_CAEEX|nr:hypothetical protein CEXT_417191 [Caerostris extrusa]